MSYAKNIPTVLMCPGPDHFSLFLNLDHILLFNCASW